VNNSTTDVKIAAVQRCEAPKSEPFAEAVGPDDNDEAEEGRWYACGPFSSCWSSTRTAPSTTPASTKRSAVHDLKVRAQEEDSKADANDKQSLPKFAVSTLHYIFKIITVLLLHGLLVVPLPVSTYLVRLMCIIRDRGSLARLHTFRPQFELTRLVLMVQMLTSTVYIGGPCIGRDLEALGSPSTLEEYIDATTEKNPTGCQNRASCAKRRARKRTRWRKALCLPSGVHVREVSTHTCCRLCLLVTSNNNNKHAYAGIPVIVLHI
jgi:hypothetical protein